MASSAQLRLMSDLKAIANEPPEGCSASPLSDDNLFVWSATIFGPDETPWEGGIFGLRIIFGDNYPEKPPRLRFTSEIFHPNGLLCIAEVMKLGPTIAQPSGFPNFPLVKYTYIKSLDFQIDEWSINEMQNVYNDGTLCMDIIQDAWSPCHNVCTILTSVQSLLTDPNPASPANPEAAQLYQHDIQGYNRRVRRCARRSIES